MAHNIPINALNRDRDFIHGAAVPDLHNYNKAHRVRGVPRLGSLDLLRDTTRLILYNVQGFTEKQIWTELNACLGDLSKAVVRVKHVTGLNRNPHADLWVRKDAGWALLSTIRRQTRFREQGFDCVVSMALGEEGEVRSEKVQQWRVALWKPWRERRLKPVNQIPRLPEQIYSGVATYNVNGVWSKKVAIDEMLGEENLAVLALQETLV